MKHLTLFLVFLPLWVSAQVRYVSDELGRIEMAIYDTPNGLVQVIYEYDTSGGRTLREISFNTLLPVDLLSFEALGQEKDNQKKSLLLWATASERGHSHFSVERSIDGKEWREIGMVYGAGTTTRKESYQFIDESPITGLNYYRLRIVSENGEEKLSPVRQVRFSERGVAWNFVVYPNPSTIADSEVTIRFSKALRVPVRVKLYDVSGSKVPYKAKEKNDYEYSLSFVNELPAGKYIIRVVSDEIGSIATKMIRQ